MYIYPVKVYYEDTDAGGVVYYANYLRYFERARTEFLNSECKLDVRELISRSIYFIVVETQLKFHHSAKYGQWLNIEVGVTELSGASFTFTYLIKDKETNNLFVSGTTKMACINDDNKVIRLPEEIKTKIKQVLSNTL